MTNPYSTTLNPQLTPQSEPLPGREADMTANRAGGHVFRISPWTQLERFLILGSESPTYYASQRETTLDNAIALLHCIGEDGPRVVSLVASIDFANRAPKRQPLLFALGAALVRGNDETKDAVVKATSTVVRTASDLFQLLSVLRDLKGGSSWWASRSIRRLIAAWYASSSASDLAYQVAKYRNRHGFTHKDALRLGHPSPPTDDHSALFAWLTSDDTPVPAGEFADQVRAFVDLQREDATTADVAKAVKDHRLTWEMLPSDALAKPEVWTALLPNLPYRALIRNLARMTAIGTLKPLSTEASVARAKITDLDAIKGSRVHPIHLLSALKTYERGEGVRGSLTWKPVDEIVHALEFAFEASFAQVEPTGKRYYIAVDVSGSMGWEEIAGVPGLTPAMAAGVLAMLAARLEERHVIRGFAGGFSHNLYVSRESVERMIDLPISASSSFADALRAMTDQNFGRTDCALPMLDALENGLEVDVFYVLTDNETWCGSIHPSQALKRYRAKTGINAKLAVVAMTATDYSIADPADGGMLDLVGFDSAAPEILRSFAMGQVG